jgi:DNA repair exonuclease SbcCD nuclease subunit
MWFNPLKARGIDFYTIAGNHTTYYKNTNDLNTIDVIYSDSVYKPKHFIDPTEIELHGKTILLLPWICDENYEKSMQIIENSSAYIAMGHLELSGFQMFRGAVNVGGLIPSAFSKYNMVLSGHFHHKSSEGNIHYLGAPSQYTWSDWDDERGVHILDLETEELTFIPNPYPMFHKVYFNDVENDYTDLLNDLANFEQYKGCYIKVIVINKDNPYILDSIVSMIEKAGAADVQVVESHFNIDIESDYDIMENTEDTLTMLKKFTLGIKNVKQREKVDSVLYELYIEAQSVAKELA